jgi:predicted transcriptional regulator
MSSIKRAKKQLEHFERIQERLQRSSRQLLDKKRFLVDDKSERMYQDAFVCLNNEMARSMSEAMSEFKQMKESVRQLQNLAWLT